MVGPGASSPLQDPSYAPLQQQYVTAANLATATGVMGRCAQWFAPCLAPWLAPWFETLVPITAAAWFWWAVVETVFGSEKEAGRFAIFPAILFSFVAYHRIQLFLSGFPGLRRAWEGYQRNESIFEEFRANVEHFESLNGSLHSDLQQEKALTGELKRKVDSLETVRKTIEDCATRSDISFDFIMNQLTCSIHKQKRIEVRTQRNLRKSRELAEAQWRAVMMNNYWQVQNQDGEKGMSRKEFEWWLAMLPMDTSGKLSCDDFDKIDRNGDGIVDEVEMREWIVFGSKTVLGDVGAVSGGEDSASDESVNTTDAFGGDGVTLPRCSRSDERKQSPTGSRDAARGPGRRASSGSADPRTLMVRGARTRRNLEPELAQAATAQSPGGASSGRSWRTPAECASWPISPATPGSRPAVRAGTEQPLCGPRPAQQRASGPRTPVISSSSGSTTASTASSRSLSSPPQEVSGIESV